MQKYYSTELPRPFLAVDKSKTGKDGIEIPISMSPMGRSPWLQSSVEAGAAELSDQNFNNVMETAYSNTLFYGKKKKK